MENNPIIYGMREYLETTIKAIWKEYGKDRNSDLFSAATILERCLNDTDTFNALNATYRDN